MKWVALITFLHFLALAILYSPPRPQPLDKMPLAIRTFELKPLPKQLETKQSVQNVPATQPPLKQPEIKKVAQNIPAAKPLPKKAPAIQSKAPTKKEKLISFLKEQKSNTPQTAADTLETLASENLKIQIAYQEELVLYLQTLLTLPEKGEVKLKCTLDRSGSVQSLQILAAASEQNRRYIEDSLCKLALPPFGTHFPNQATHTFVLSLTSENCH